MTNNLQVLRRINNLSQEDLARDIDISISSVRNWEQKRSDLSSASFLTILRICNVLNCSFFELFENDPEICEFLIDMK